MNIEKINITVPEEFPPESRLDHVLTALFPQYSRSFIQQAVKSGEVTHQDRTPCKCSEPVNPGDILVCAITPPKDLTPVAEEIPLEILYEDDDLLVINKEPGIVVHPAPGTEDNTIVNALLARYPKEFAKLQEEDQLRPGIVHRLDKDTSGLLVVAKNLATQHALKEAFQQRTVKKTYLAVVTGTMKPEDGTVSLALGRDPKNRLRWAVVPEEEGKMAVTEYHTLQSFRGYSLVKIRLHTGRTHQIRVHFSHLGHPVLGDSLYGHPPKNAPKRQMLHAWKIAFHHPVTNELISVTANPPRDFRHVVNVLTEGTQVH